MRIVASTSPSRFEAHAGLFRLLMKGKFDAFDKKVFELVTPVNTHDFTVSRIQIQACFHIHVGMSTTSYNMCYHLTGSVCQFLLNNL